MSIFLTLASLFFVGSVLGWVLELLFRNIVHKNKKWVNPGFCTGPYLPIYGFGLCTLYLLASLEKYGMITNPLLNKLVLFAAMAVGMTLIEYIAGLFCLKYFKVMLWDYSDQWGNIQGLICPLFSAIWAFMGAVYYFFVHPYILSALDWLSNNLAFSFVIGFFFGVFVIDVVYSSHLLAKLKEYADENDVVVKWEHLKAEIRSAQDRAAKRAYFVFAFRSDRALLEHLKEAHAALEEIRHRVKNH